MRRPSSEPEFRAWRKRLLTRLLILCIIAIPVGIIMKLPIVWILAIAGVIVAAIKLTLMKTLTESVEPEVGRVSSEATPNASPDEPSM